MGGGDFGGYRAVQGLGSAGDLWGFQGRFAVNIQVPELISGAKCDDLGSWLGWRSSRVRS
ncbi:hypothetical protein A8926_5763 [Saccharopolyspora spinosa]|uniref:Uncharacterized protein n=1 Tax=Saccharopolyspora spinosa TaxID=60894 RepID=A0A2N3Y4J6_SACSN|nr:hypothetical protein A8926_5763 [Saccharopolyspora spinosa]